MKIKTTGLKGLYNRINLFSSIIREDVFDITTRLDSSENIASNRVMLTMRTQKLLNSGKDMSETEFSDILSQYGGRISSSDELKSIRTLFQPEFNVGNNKPGIGYKNTANRIMLVSRAECHIWTRQDLMSYQYIEILQNNSGMIMK